MRTKITAPAVAGAVGAGLLAGTLFAGPAGATVTPASAPQAVSQSVTATTRTAGLQFHPCHRCHRFHHFHRFHHWNRWGNWGGGWRWNNWNDWGGW
ncbi:hypothetical protein [Streptosporangium sandarakinum]|uniref:hypothetical protein n=1 Tax=Streptosporangium sandarakinum TaxID=1260955 RepID=UPI0033AD6537